MALLSDIIHICISAKNVLWNDTDNFLRYLFIKIFNNILSAKYVLSYQSIARLVVEWQSFNNSLSMCGQLEGRRVGKGVIIITSAAPGKHSSHTLGGDFSRYLKHFGTATWFPSYIGFIANYPIKNVIMIDDSYQNPCTQNNSQTSFLRTRSMTIDSG